MEIEVTDFFNQAAPMDYSASAAELGQDAGRITWRHACEAAPDYPHLDTEEKREAFREYIRGFGAWSDGEIAAWSDVELGALFLQCVAGDIREAGLDTDAPDWAAYQAGAEGGQYSGRLFCGEDGRVYYYVGS